MQRGAETKVTIKDLEAFFGDGLEPSRRRLPNEDSLPHTSVGRHERARVAMSLYRTLRSGLATRLGLASLRRTDGVEAEAALPASPSTA